MRCEVPAIAEGMVAAGFASKRWRILKANWLSATVEKYSASRLALAQQYTDS